MRKTQANDILIDVIGKTLTNNILLKGVSVAVAVVVWLLVVNVDDPIITSNIAGVAVQVQNEAYIESGGKMSLIKEGENIISVEVKGKRSIVDKLTPEDLVATAYLKQIVNMNTDPIMVPIAVTCSRLKSADLIPNPRNLSVDIDDIMTQEYIVTVTSGESQPGKGYEIGTLSANPDKVSITGPQSLVRKIDKVVASVDASNLQENTTKQVGLEIIDKNQEKISESQMNYLKYDTSVPKVYVSVGLWAIQNDVSIKGGYVGKALDGYKVDKITFTPENISVAGSQEALEALTAEGKVIRVPDETIDVTGKNSDFEVKVNIEKLLPDNVKLTKDTSDTVIASVSILPQDSKEYSVLTTDITGQNVADGLQLVYETEKVQIRIRENGAQLAQLKESDIKVSVDLSGRTEGTYLVPVKVSLPPGYDLVEQQNTTVKLVKPVKGGR